MDLNITVLLLAQLNQESVKAGRRPRASDLRESTALMSDSNAVVLIYNPSAEARTAAYRNGEDVTDADELEEVDLISGKVRDGGKPGTVRVIFRTTCTRFESWTGDVRELPAAAPAPPANTNRRRSA
jgi:replicative DNA helicase